MSVKPTRCLSVQAGLAAGKLTPPVWADNRGATNRPVANATVERRVVEFMVWETYKKPIETKGQNVNIPRPRAQPGACTVAQAFQSAGSRDIPAPWHQRPAAVRRKLSGFGASRKHCVSLPRTNPFTAGNNWSAAQIPGLARNALPMPFSTFDLRLSSGFGVSGGRFYFTGCDKDCPSLHYRNSSFFNTSRSVSLVPQNIFIHDTFGFFAKSFKC
jgi:hypothetical protein